MNPNRLRWGAVAWLLTMQFFVAETIAQLRFEGGYSRADDVISTLGTAESAARQLMNASFVLQAALIVGGALLLRPTLLGVAGRTVPWLLGAAGVGVLLVGVFPSDGNALVHTSGAVAYLVGGGLGLIALAYSVRPRSEALGTLLALLGLVGTATTVFFLTGVVLLGEGGTERVAAYVLPLGLAVAAVGLWRLAAGTTPPTDGMDGGGDDRPGRRDLRDQARAAREESERRRDEALREAAARRGGEDPENDDPRAAPVRRRGE